MTELGVPFTIAALAIKAKAEPAVMGWDDWHESLPTPRAPPTTPAPKVKAKPQFRTIDDAALFIVRWVERRFDQVFWTCRRCVRWGPCVPEHHSRVSNFGICESCHNEVTDDDLQSDVNYRYGRYARSRFDPDYDGMDNLRWVGPRNTRDNLRAWAVHDKRLEPFYWHKKQFVHYHEELMAAAWHPSRVAKWLEQGEDVLDMMMGTD
jgi:hypothetical protein